MTGQQTESKAAACQLFYSIPINRACEAFSVRFPFKLGLSLSSFWLHDSWFQTFINIWPFSPQNVFTHSMMCCVVQTNLRQFLSKRRYGWRDLPSPKEGGQPGSRTTEKIERTKQSVTRERKNSKAQKQEGRKERRKEGRRKEGGKERKEGRKERRQEDMRGRKKTKK